MLPKKEVPITSLNVGDTFDSYKEGGTWHSASFEIINKEPYYVVVRSFNSYDENVSNDAIVELEYTDEELLSTYEKDTLEVITAMENQLYDEGDAIHEMWNGWTWDPSPAETAIRAKQEGLTFIGWFYLKNSRNYDDCDIGVVAEYEDGDRIWCHAKKKWYDSWKRHFPELYRKAGIIDA